jgi:CDP-4-dehydro-6-deoxyglucose reductase
MQARLIESHEIAPEVRHFLFEAEDIQRLEYTPGQFVSFEAECDGKAITRAYSIASAPRGSNCFELCLNRVKEGRLSPRLFAMQPGDAIEMRPPLGMFTMRRPPRDSVFVATGTGIAPFRAMLQGQMNEARLNESAPAITLLFGVRYESHLMYRAEFEEMARRFAQFRFWPTLSRPAEEWPGRRGHVQAHLDEAIGDRRDLDVYLCGLKLMVDDVRAILKRTGFDRKQIFYEKYD